MVLLAQKRIVSGDLTDQDLVAALETHSPDAIVLCTHLLDGYTAFRARLRERYRLHDEWTLPRTFSRRATATCTLLSPADRRE